MAVPWNSNSRHHRRADYDAATTEASHLKAEQRSIPIHDRMLCIRRPYPGRGKGATLRSWAFGTIVVVTIFDSFWLVVIIFRRRW